MKDSDAVVLGFQLLCVFAISFGPSKEFMPFVQNFLTAKLDRPDDGIGVMTKCTHGVHLRLSSIADDRHLDCIAKLEIMASKGGRPKALTIGEIEHASVSLAESLSQLSASGYEAESS